MDAFACLCCVGFVWCIQWLSCLFVYGLRSEFSVWRLWFGLAVG